MTGTPAPITPTPDDVALVLESARRLGIELDETETARWLAAMTAGTTAAGAEVPDVVVDDDAGSSAIGSACSTSAPGSSTASAGSARSSR